MTATPAGQRAGKIMLMLAWVAALALATHFFGVWEQRQVNPNPQPESVHGRDYIEVRLASARGGHYRLNGQINGQAVTFLIDTGATAVAIPRELGNRLGLKPGSPVALSTANGIAEGRRTRLASLQLGDIRLRDVAAILAPNMPDNEVLLGMSALKQLEFTQRDGTLVLRQSTR